MNDTNKTLDAVREAVDPRVEIAAEALGLHRYRHFDPGNGPTVRWPTSPQDTLSGRDGTVPLTWDFAEQCRSEVAAILAALDIRAGDAGEVERLRKGLERARSDLHLVTLHGSVRPMWEEAKAARDRVHEVLTATPAPAVDEPTTSTAIAAETDLPTDRYGMTVLDRMRDTAENATMPPEDREDLFALLDLAAAPKAASAPAVDAVPAGEVRNSTGGDHADQR